MNNLNKLRESSQIIAKHLYVINKKNGYVMLSDIQNALEFIGGDNSEIEILSDFFKANEIEICINYSDAEDYIKLEKKIRTKIFFKEDIADSELDNKIKLSKVISLEDLIKTHYGIPNDTTSGIKYVTKQNLSSKEKAIVDCFKNIFDILVIIKSIKCAIDFKKNLSSKEAVVVDCLKNILDILTKLANEAMSPDEINLLFEDLISIESNLMREAILYVGLVGVQFEDGYSTLMSAMLFLDTFKF